ncbi:MAG TPA: radical SAM protein [Patescibacteria group bacterium]|nr:radical SAM protein [Patescibacteria group bacterium]
MKIALLYPYIKRHFPGCNPPISLLYLAASLKRAGEKLIVIDADNGDLTTHDIVKRVFDYSPDLVGIPLFSTYLPAAHKLVTMLDAGSRRWKILLGGPHATARPREVLETFAGCDYVLRGECERSIVGLARHLEGRMDISEIEGLSYRKNGRTAHNPDEPLNMDLDSIDFPAREFLADAYRDRVYWRIGHRGATDVIITSRGCPYNCHFCFKISKKFRVRSPENILAELVEIRSLGTRNVHIMDDLFVWNKQNCLKTLAMIKRHKLRMNFKVRARTDLIDEELLVAMRDAGVKSVVYGIESGSQELLDRMNKRTTVEMNRRAIELTKKVGMQCYADLFIGFPGETPATIRETEKLITETKPTAVNCSVMYPLPDTKVYNDARANGTLMGDWDAEGTRPWIKLPWIENVSTLWAYRDNLLRKYISNPIVILNAARYWLFNIDFRQFIALVRYVYRFASSKA